MDTQPEPWLRGTLTEFDAVKRQVLHALEQAEEDVVRWCAPLTDTQIEATPCGLPAVAFQLRHIARSLDRILTYAEGRALSAGQLESLAAEHEVRQSAAEALTECQASLAESRHRVAALTNYEASRLVGRAGLPSTVGGLMIHAAEHTQRHIGQAITTAKVVIALT